MSAPSRPGPARLRGLDRFRYGFLLAVRWLCRRCYDYDFGWLEEPEGDPWLDAGIVIILNHTSLFEPLFLGGVPRRFVRRIATAGLVPIATKTMDRPVVGRIFRLLVPEIVPVTRERDETWEAYLDRSEDPATLVFLLPEGRMKRRTGLDARGGPMTVLGGVADVLERARSDERMLLAYSGGLHHVHAPGDRFFRLFEELTMSLEAVDLRPYRETLRSTAGAVGFKEATVADLTRRRDDHCREDGPGDDTGSEAPAESPGAGRQGRG